MIGHPGRSRCATASTRVTSARRANIASLPPSCRNTSQVAGPSVNWMSTSVPSLSNRMARIGIAPSKLLGFACMAIKDPPRRTQPALMSLPRHHARPPRCLSPRCSRSAPGGRAGRSAAAPASSRGAGIIPLPPLRPAILPTPAEPPPPSACQIRLPDIAAVEILPPVIGTDGCGIDDAVRLSSV